MQRKVPASRARKTNRTGPAPAGSNSVSERALLLLEIVATFSGPVTLNELTALANLPKATVHRFAMLLVELGFVERTLDGKRFAVGPRFGALAASAMRNSIQWGPRRAILQDLVAQVRETCNITVLDGTELVYLDRVESAWPIQINLNVGSRVPLYCTASGKLFLALSPPAIRTALLDALPMKRHTPRTIVEPARLAKELARIAESGVGTDDEEFIDGMSAAAVPVLDSRKRMVATVAVHGPTSRLTLEAALAHVPALRAAADRLASSYLAPAHAPRAS